MANTRSFAAGELTFDAWRMLVDEEVLRLTGAFVAADFRDWSYAETFEDEVEPDEAAHLALNEDAYGREFLALARIDMPERVA